MAKATDTGETRSTRLRYNRIAPLYDLMESAVEGRYRLWRQRLWGLVTGPRVLEIGVGSGKNIPFYPPGVQITAVDLSERMLDRAARRARRLGRPAFLVQMDAQALAFPEATFHSVVATFVFCSVPNAVRGLQEAARVIRPGGRVLLLEHVRPAHPVLGRVMDLLDPFVFRLCGPHINRRTVDNVHRAELAIERVEDLDTWGIFKLIVARRPSP